MFLGFDGVGQEVGERNVGCVYIKTSLRRNAFLKTEENGAERNEMKNEWIIPENERSCRFSKFYICIYGIP